MRKTSALSAVAATGLGLALAMATPTYAADATDRGSREGTVRIQEPSDLQALAGWLGTCYPERSATRAGGWCDGNGPNWNYSGWVRCSNGNEYYGPWKWAGDRTKSYAYCPSGTSSVSGGLDVAYFS
ncbi:hypothetical protein [Streptomyces sp. SID1121]|uniref:hypothetical protein n=1 Tax=Streptomyces sp. SID1121 TaxID=3425888 RepID=UPI004056EB31